MCAQTTHEGADVTEPFESGWSWQAGAASGFVATVVMGTAISLGDLAVLREAIAGLYTMEGSLVAGWVAHLAHGTLFGMVFAAVLSDPALHRISDWVWKTALAGVVYALVLAVAGAGIIMPIWLSIVGFGSPPEVPNVSTPLVAWHVVYGVVLGGAYAAVDGR